MDHQIQQALLPRKSLTLPFIFTPRLSLLLKVFRPAAQPAPVCSHAAAGMSFLNKQSNPFSPLVKKSFSVGWLPSRHNATFPSIHSPSLISTAFSVSLVPLQVPSSQRDPLKSQCPLPLFQRCRHALSFSRSFGTQFSIPSSKGTVTLPSGLVGAQSFPLI